MGGGVKNKSTPLQYTPSIPEFMPWQDASITLMTSEMSSRKIIAETSAGAAAVWPNPKLPLLPDIRQKSG